MYNQMTAVSLKSVSTKTRVVLPAALELDVLGFATGSICDKHFPASENAAHALGTSLKVNLAMRRSIVKY